MFDLIGYKKLKRYDDPVKDNLLTSEHFVSYLYSRHEIAEREYAKNKDQYIDEIKECVVQAMAFPELSLNGAFFWSCIFSGINANEYSYPHQGRYCQASLNDGVELKIDIGCMTSHDITSLNIACKIYEENYPIDVAPEIIVDYIKNMNRGDFVDHLNKIVAIQNTAFSHPCLIRCGFRIGELHLALETWDESLEKQEAFRNEFLNSPFCRIWVAKKIYLNKLH